MPADDKEHDLDFDVPIEQKQLGGPAALPADAHQPGERDRRRQADPRIPESAQWCIDVIEQLWKVRGPGIKADERAEAERVFQWAIGRYQKIAEEAAPFEPLAAAWRTNPEELARLLEASLKENDFKSAHTFVDAIGSQGPQLKENAAILKTLTSAMAHPKEEIRVAVFNALLRTDPALKQMPKLVGRVLTDKEAKTPLTFLKAVREAGEPFAHSVASLRVGLDHASPEVRLETVRLLLAYGQPFRKDAAAVEAATDVVLAILKDAKKKPFEAIVLAAEFGSQGKKLVPELDRLASTTKDSDVIFASRLAISQIDYTKLPAYSGQPLHYIPLDAAAVSQVRVKALVEVPFIKKDFLTELRRDTKTWKVLEKLQVDAFTEVNSVTVADERIPGGPDWPLRISLLPAVTDGLLIMQGDFPKAPLYKMVESTVDARTTYAMCVPGKLIFVSNRKEMVLAALRYGMESRKQPPQFADPVALVLSSHTIWQVTIPKEKGVNASLLTLAVNELGGRMTINYFVADDETVKKLLPAGGLLGASIVERLKDIAAESKIDSKNMKSTVVGEDNIMRIRVDLAFP